MAPTALLSAWLCLAALPCIAGIDYGDCKGRECLQFLDQTPGGEGVVDLKAIIMQLHLKPFAQRVDWEQELLATIQAANQGHVDCTDDRPCYHQVGFCCTLTSNNQIPTDVTTGHCQQFEAFSSRYQACRPG